MTTTPDTSSPGPSRGRRIAARTLVVLGVLLRRRQPALELGQAGGARSRNVSYHLGGADRASGDPGSGRAGDGRPAVRERRRLGPAPAEAAAEPPVSGRADRGSRAGGDRPGRDGAARPAPRPDALHHGGVSRAEPGRQGARGRYDAPLHDQRRRGARPPPACRPAGRSIRLPGGRLHPVATGRRARHDPAVGRARHRTEPHAAPQDGRGLDLDPDAPRLCGCALARPGQAAQGGARDRDRARRRGCRAARHPPGRRLVPRRPSHVVRLGASRGQRVLDDPLGRARRGCVGRGLHRRHRDARCLAHRRGPTCRGRAPVARPMARERRHRVGGVRSGAADRRLGAPVAPVRDDCDPRRPRRRRVRGRPTPDRRRVRGGGPRAAPRGPGDAVAEARVRNRADSGRGARAAREAPVGRPPHRGGVRGGEGSASCRRRAT